MLLESVIFYGADTKFDRAIEATMSFKDASVYARARIIHANAVIAEDNVTRFTETVAGDLQTQKFVEKIRECEKLLDDLVDILDDDDDFSIPYFEEHRNNLWSIIQSYTEALDNWIDCKVWICVAEFAREKADKIKASGNAAISVSFKQAIPPPLRRAMESSSLDLTLLLGLNALSARGEHQDENLGDATDETWRQASELVIIDYVRWYPKVD
jgi:hypothetical protein